MSVSVIVILGGVYIFIGASISRTIIKRSKKKDYSKVGTTFSEDLSLVMIMFFWPLFLIISALIVLAGGKAGSDNK